MMRAALSLLLTTALAAALFFRAALAVPESLEEARDLEDRPQLEHALAECTTTAEKAPNDASAQYRMALAASYLAEISLELRDKAAAERAAKAGIPAAERAVSLKPENAE